MIPVTTFADKKVAVFGLGGSGLLTARALKAGGAHVIAWDDAPLKNEQANAAGIETANLADIDWSDIAALVLSPGVPLTHPTPHWTAQRATLEGVEIIGDIELFCRERAAQVSSLGLDCPLVAITGTNGKSTTTALTAHLIASAGRDVQMGGNIGTPVLALEPFATGRHYVIEVSSYQIDLAPSLRPTVGVFINLSADHLDRHGTIENYAAIKTLVVAQVEQGGTAVVGVDDRWAREAADRVERAGRKVVRISVEGSLRDGYFAEGARIMRGTAGKSYPAVQLTGIGSLRGKHNAQNAACAVATCVALGIELPAIQKGLVSFPGLAHRMQAVARKTTASGHILYVNDSKATNADSTAKALASFPDIFWIAGGKPKSGGIESLSEFWPRIRKAYLIGEAAEDFAATLGGKVDHQIDGVLSKAVEAATRDAEASGLKEAVILLSPACASFDQYPNFEVRGKAFTDLVLATRGVEKI